MKSSHAPAPNVTLLEERQRPRLEPYAQVEPRGSIHLTNDPHHMRMGSSARSSAGGISIGRSEHARVIWGGYVGFTDRAGDRGTHGHSIRSIYRRRVTQRVRSILFKALKQISPAIDPGALVEATWSELLGHVDLVHATTPAIPCGCERAGARVLFPAPVTAIEPGGGGVTGSHTTGTASGSIP